MPAADRNHAESVFSIGQPFLSVLPKEATGKKYFGPHSECKSLFFDKTCAMPTPKNMSPAHSELKTPKEKSVGYIKDSDVKKLHQIVHPNKAQAKAQQPLKHPTSSKKIADQKEVRNPPPLPTKMKPPTVAKIPRSSGGVSPAPKIDVPLAKPKSDIDIKTKVIDFPKEEPQTQCNTKYAAMSRKSLQSYTAVEETVNKPKPRSQSPAPSETETEILDTKAAAPSPSPAPAEAEAPGSREGDRKPFSSQSPARRPSRTERLGLKSTIPSAMIRPNSRRSSSKLNEPVAQRPAKDELKIAKHKDFSSSKRKDVSPSKKPAKVEHGRKDLSPMRRQSARKTQPSRPKEEVKTKTEQEVEELGFFQKLQQNVKAYFVSRPSEANPELSETETKSEKKNGDDTDEADTSSASLPHTRTRSPNVSSADNDDRGYRSRSTSSSRRKVLGNVFGKRENRNHFYEKIRQKKIYKPKPCYAGVRIPQKPYCHRVITYEIPKSPPGSVEGTDMDNATVPGMTSKKVEYLMRKRRVTTMERSTEEIAKRNEIASTGQSMISSEAKASLNDMMKNKIVIQEPVKRTFSRSPVRRKSRRDAAKLFRTENDEDSNNEVGEDDVTLRSRSMSIISGQSSIAETDMTAAMYTLIRSSQPDTDRYLEKYRKLFSTVLTEEQKSELRKTHPELDIYLDLYKEIVSHVTSENPQVCRPEEKNCSFEAEKEAAAIEIDSNVDPIRLRLDDHLEISVSELVSEETNERPKFENLQTDLDLSIANNFPWKPENTFQNRVAMQPGACPESEEICKLQETEKLIQEATYHVSRPVVLGAFVDKPEPQELLSSAKPDFVHYLELYQEMLSNFVESDRLNLPNSKTKFTSTHSFQKKVDVTKAVEINDGKGESAVNDNELDSSVSQEMADVQVLYYRLMEVALKGSGQIEPSKVPALKKLEYEVCNDSLEKNKFKKNIEEKLDAPSKPLEISSHVISVGDANCHNNTPRLALPDSDIESESDDFFSLDQPLSICKSNGVSRQSSCLGNINTEIDEEKPLAKVSMTQTLTPRRWSETAVLMKEIYLKEENITEEEQSELVTVAVSEPQSCCLLETSHLLFLQDDGQTQIEQFKTAYLEGLNDLIKTDSYESDNDPLLPVVCFAMSYEEPLISKRNRILRKIPFSEPNEKITVERVRNDMLGRVFFLGQVVHYDSPAKLRQAETEIPMLETSTLVFIESVAMQRIETLLRKITVEIPEMEETLTIEMHVPSKTREEDLGLLVLSGPFSNSVQVEVPTETEFEIAELYDFAVCQQFPVVFATPVERRLETSCSFEIVKEHATVLRVEGVGCIPQERRSSAFLVEQHENVSVSSSRSTREEDNHVFTTEKSSVVVSSVEFQVSSCHQRKVNREETTHSSFGGAQVFVTLLKTLSNAVKNQPSEEKMKRELAAAANKLISSGSQNNAAKTNESGMELLRVIQKMPENQKKKLRQELFFDREDTILDSNYVSSSVIGDKLHANLSDTFDGENVSYRSCFSQKSETSLTIESLTSLRRRVQFASKLENKQKILSLIDYNINKLKMKMLTDSERSFFSASSSTNWEEGNHRVSKNDRLRAVKHSGIPEIRSDPECEKDYGGMKQREQYGILKQESDTRVVRSNSSKYFDAFESLSQLHQTLEGSEMKVKKKAKTEDSDSLYKEAIRNLQADDLHSLRHGMSLLENLVSGSGRNKNSNSYVNEKDQGTPKDSRTSLFEDIANALRGNRKTTVTSPNASQDFLVLNEYEEKSSRKGFEQRIGDDIRSRYLSERFHNTFRHEVGCEKSQHEVLFEQDNVQDFTSLVKTLASTLSKLRDKTVDLLDGAQERDSNDLSNISGQISAASGRTFDSDSSSSLLEDELSTLRRLKGKIENEKLRVEELSMKVRSGEIKNEEKLEKNRIMQKIRRLKKAFLLLEKQISRSKRKLGRGSREYKEVTESHCMTMSINTQNNISTNSENPLLKYTDVVETSGKEERMNSISRWVQGIFQMNESKLRELKMRLFEGRKVKESEDSVTSGNIVDIDVDTLRRKSRKTNAVEVIHEEVLFENQSTFSRSSSKVDYAKWSREFVRATNVCYRGSRPRTAPPDLQ